ncbi:acyl-coenzyme A thioesterase 9, mitochondrial-like isoform X2 [Mytilus edulis]|uniref:acyl-coenzyme A thioesterase 9, mitochondrial-like isoform X1 n=1 Tax=Mytilus edulis TaxID=6550 RepID=UPI0039F0F34E
MDSLLKLTRKIPSGLQRSYQCRRKLLSQSWRTRNYSQTNTSIQTIQTARNRLKELVGAQLSWGTQIQDAGSETNIITQQSDLPTRTISDSYTEAMIPVGTDEILREKYINFYGGMRFGRILEDLDTFAVLISYTHSTQGTEKKSPISIVTALVDRIELGEKPFSPFKDIKMKGSVTWAGKTSMEITMNLEQEDASEWKKVLTARFVMVARNPLTKKSAFINALQLTSQEEEKIFELGEVNKVKRQEEAKRNLLKTPPHENEIQIVHEHFLKTLDPSSSTFKIRVKPENSVWMDQTKLKNLIICFPEQRNLYNKIFGGYLMRKAFELAWTSAALYSKSRQVAITTVDDIVFRKPVEIGSLLFLSSEVVYTNGSKLQLKVHAEVVNPTDYTRATTNDFHFTFDTKQEDLPSVIPKTYAEFMLFLDGKRHYES